MSISNYLFDEISSPCLSFPELNPDILNSNPDEIIQKEKEESSDLPKFTQLSTSAENTEHEHSEEVKVCKCESQNDPFIEAIKLYNYRKRKNIRVAEEIETIKDSKGIYNYTENPKEYMKARKRMQNRESAQRTKFYKNMYLVNIQKELEEKSNQNQKLNTEITKLKTENEFLKRQLKYFEDLFAKQNQVISEDTENPPLALEPETYDTNSIFYGASSNYNSPRRSFFTAFTIFISIIALTSFIIGPEESVIHSGFGIKGSELGYGIISYVIGILLNPYLLIVISIISQIILFSSNTEFYRKGRRIIRKFWKHRKHT